MAAQLGLSVSYLSQLENDDRPVTRMVDDALARAFPSAWDPAAARAGGRLAALRAAAADPLFADLGRADGLARAAEAQPALAERFVRLHGAYRRLEEHRQIADEALATGDAGPERQPWEEVRDWFHAEGNYVDALDRAAEALGVAMASDPPEDEPLALRLRERHGVRLAPRDGGDGPLAAYDAATGTLALDRALPPESRRFLVAHQLAAIEFADMIAALADAAALRTDIARRLLALGLANYAAGAMLMPYARFASAAREMRHDIDRLRQGFGVSFEQACHRLSTLQRPGARGVPFFFCRVDMAGNITKRHSATRLQFARFGGACPLWVVHEAVAIPDRILVQLAETPDGERYVSMAKGLVKPSGSYARSPRRYAVALGCEAKHAAEFIYADGMPADGPATPIGVSCRLCPRPDCDQRAFPPADRGIAIDPHVRGAVPYRVL